MPSSSPVPSSSVECAPLDLARALLRVRSTTPARGAVFDLVRNRLEGMGLSCRRFLFGEDSDVENLYGRIGTESPVFAFCGHLDTVPEGRGSDWTCDPYAGEVREGCLIGRGAVDMKSSVAAFTCALEQFLAERPAFGSIVVLLTGDEEGEARFGTQALLEALPAEDKRFDACLTGEPTSRERLGDQIKLGRRGSLSLRVRALGVMGHSAYPDRSDNAAHSLVRFLRDLIDLELDAGTEDFSASHLQVACLQTDSQVANVVPGHAEALVNIRYNTLHTHQSLLALLRTRAQQTGGAIDFDTLSSCEAFLSEKGLFAEGVASVVHDTLGVAARFSTEGGTSDSRFLHTLCPTLDFGPVGASMHQVDESISLSELALLCVCYREILTRFFAEQGWR